MSSDKSLVSPKVAPGAVSSGIFNAVPPAPADGQAVALQTDSQGNLLVAPPPTGALFNENLVEVAGSAVTTTGVPGEQKVGIVGSTGVALDSAAGTPNAQALTIQGNASGVGVPVTQPTAANLNATVTQGPRAALNGSWPVKITNDVNAADVKAGSVAAIAADASLVVQLSPNSSGPVATKAQISTSAPSASWTSATPQGTALTVNCQGFNTATIGLNIAGTITGGTVIVYGTDSTGHTGYIPVAFRGNTSLAYTPSIEDATQQFSVAQPAGNFFAVINCAGLNNISIVIGTVIVGSGTLNVNIQADATVSVPPFTQLSDGTNTARIDSGGNLKNVQKAQIGTSASATWNNGTAQNTTLVIPTAGLNTVVVSFNITGTISVGTIKLIGQTAVAAGLNAVGLPFSFSPQWNQGAGLPYAPSVSLDLSTITPGETGEIVVNCAGFSSVSVLLAQAITGSGSISITGQADATQNVDGKFTRIVGSTLGTLDAPGQNAAAPANELIVGGQFNTTPTTIASGNVSPLQLDSGGNLKDVQKAQIGTNASATWNSGTAQFTTVSVPTAGYSTCIISMALTGAFTGGAISALGFTFNGGNVPIPIQLYSNGMPNSFPVAPGPVINLTSLVSGAGLYYVAVVNCAGFTSVGLILQAAITGGGSLAFTVQTDNTVPAPNFMPMAAAYNTTVPAPSNLETAFLQTDAAANLRINPYGNIGSFASKKVTGASGANAVLTVPAGKKWVLYNVFISLTTSATAGNRGLNLEINDTGNAVGFFQALASPTTAVTQGPSLSQNYQFSPAGTYYQTAVLGGNFLFPLSIFNLGPSFTIQTVVTNIQAGDVAVLLAEVIEVSD
jgi:hypothetical protein